jgi:hypothetical protein
MSDHDKISDLMARMRTCAAFILSRPHDGADAYLGDAATLLNEAASVLESYRPKTEPMEIIEALPMHPFAIKNDSVDMTPRFTDPGLPVHVIHSPDNRTSKNACPGCDSRASKIVHRVDNWIELECSVCGARWPYSSIGKAIWR